MDRRAAQGDLEAVLDAACGAGVDLIQLRDKHATRDEQREASKVFRAVARRHDALFVMNDDPTLATEVGADGVHVGQEDTSPEQARLVAGEDLLVGRSTHSVAQIDQALEEDCDYFTVGPVHPTPTKEGRPGIGLGPVRYAAQVADRPWFVSGAMSMATSPAVLAAGASRLVVVRAITHAADPAAAVRALVRLLGRR